MSTGHDLAPKAYEQIRDALCTLCYASDGHFEDEAQVATLPNVAVEQR